MTTEVLESRQLLTTTYFDAGVLTSANTTFQDSVQGSDADIYRFSLAAASDVTASLSGLADTVSMTIARDLNGNDIIDTGETVQNANFINSTFAMTEPLSIGDYLVRITPTNTNDSTTYTLKLAAVAIAGAQDAGSTLGTATNAGPLTTNANNFVDVIQNGDLDIFRFQLSSASNLSAAFTGLNEAVEIQLIRDLNVNSQIDTGEIVQRATFVSSSPFTMSEPLSPGEYFIRIAPENTTDNTKYTLNLTATTIPGAQDAGSTLATAYNAGTLTTNPSTAVDVIQNGDLDIYRFQLTASSDLSASFTGLDESVEIELIRDLNGNSQVDTGEIVQRATFVSSDPFSMVEPLSPGEYFIRISPENTTDNSEYLISLSAIPIPGAKDAGNTLATARNAGPLTTAPNNFVDVNQNGDIDVHRFQLTADSTVTATFSGLSESIQIQLVKDSNGNGQIDTGETIKNVNFVSQTYTLTQALAAGEYYIRVSPSNTTDNTSFTLSLNSTIAPQPPAIGGFDTAISYAENGAAVVLDADATIVDVDSLDFDTGSLRINLAANGEATDRLEIINQGQAAGQIGVNGTSVTYEGVTIGTFGGGAGLLDLVIVLNANATPIAVQALLRNITYRSVSDNPSTAQRTVRVSVSDGDLTSNQPTKLINVTGLNDVPVAQASTVSTNMNTARTFATSDFLFNDPEGNSLVSITVSALSLAGGDTLTVNLGAGPVTVTNGLTITAAQIATLTYTPATAVIGVARSSFGFKANDAGLGTVSATMSIDVTPVNQVPEAQASAVTTSEDTARNFAASDFLFSDFEGNNLSSITVSGVTLATGDTLKVNQGAGLVNVTNGMTITAARISSLVYTPAANASGSNRTTFNFRVNDAGQGTVVAPLTISVTAANDLPVAQASSVTTLEDTSKTFVLADFPFTDVEGDSLVSITVSSMNLASGDTLQVDHGAGLVAVTNGTTIAAAKIPSLVYTPAANSSGTSRSTFGFKVNDAGLGSVAATMSINVTAVNETPTDIALPTTAIAENQPAGSFVGAFTTIDPDSGDTFTYTLVPGVGDTDNSSFTISNNQLLTTGSFDFETKSSYTIRVRSTDLGGLLFEKQFTITVNNNQEAPTDLTLSASTIAENQPAGTVIGSFTSNDSDIGNTFTYSLVTGAGSGDNSSFTITNGQLVTASSFNFEVKNNYAVRVRTTDQDGLTFEKQFTVTVTNANETPIDLTLATTTVAENQLAGALVGVFSTTDVDLSNTFTYSLVAGAGSSDNSSFVISNDELLTAAEFNFETKSSYEVRVRATDQDGLSFEKQLTITVTNANEAPTDITLSVATVAENQPGGTAIGTFSSTDPDASSTFTYSLVTGAGSTDNSNFAISNGQLQTVGGFNFESKNSYAIRVRTTDQGGLTFEKQFMINVTNLNEAPTDLVLSATSVAENQPSGTLVGTLSSTDADAGSTFVYTLVDGMGSDDNSAFSISNGQLLTSTGFNFEAKPTYSIRVRSTDQNGLSIEKVVALTITNVNEAPSAINLSSSVIAENLPAGSTIGTLSSIDPDANSVVTFSLVNGPGSTHNDSFAIIDGQLQTIQSLDFETQNFNTIRVRSTDQAGLFFETILTVTVTNVNETPVIQSNQSFTIEENPAANAIVGTIAASDPDTTMPFSNKTFSILSGNTADAFAIDQLTGQISIKTPSQLDFELNSVYTLLVGLSDGGGASAPPTSIAVHVSDINEVPTVSTIGAQVLAEDGVTGTIAFSISDPETAAGTLTVQATSSNQGLIPDGNLTLSGNGIVRGIVVKPLANQAGTATITVTVSDGANVSTRTFPVNVLSVNDAPALSSFLPQSIFEDTATAPLAFTLGDVDNGLENLTITVTSSNTALLPNAGITIDGAGSTRTLTATPSPNRSGSAVIAVSVSDGTLTTVQELQITVNAVDDPATITMNSQPLAYRVGSKQVIPIDSAATVSDVDSPSVSFSSSVVRVSGQRAKDQLSIPSQGGISAKGKRLLFNGLQIGTIAGGKKAAPLIVTLNSAATQPAVQALLRGLSFKSLDKVAGDRTLQIQITNVGGTTTLNASRQVVVGS